MIHVLFITFKNDISMLCSIHSYIYLLYIFLLQIQFSPLRQYAYVPGSNSQKIEGKSKHHDS